MSHRAPLLAALPMYDFPHVAWANDALWRVIGDRLRAGGLAAPEALTRGGDIAAQWRDPGLILGQTCGYPYITDLRDAVTLIATPEYAFPGCEGATHRSFLVRRADDPRRELAAFRGSTAAVNAWDSNTGMNLFRAAIAPFAQRAPFFGTVVTTGAHAASLKAVAAGDADLAAIDCVSFALIARADPGLRERVLVVAASPRSPCLPFIANARLPPAAIAATRDALYAALVDPTLATACEALGLRGARPAAREDYQVALMIEREAFAAGYPRLA
jgi:ABC-type phosphate/phosphonate transport system substrate-binding protein